MAAIRLLILEAIVLRRFSIHFTRNGEISLQYHDDVTMDFYFLPLFGFNFPSYNNDSNKINNNNNNNN